MARTLITMILIFGILILGFVYLGPAWSEYSATRQATQELQEISQELDNLIINKDQLISSVNRISKENLDRMDVALPSNKKAAELLVFFESVAGKNSLVLKNIDLEEKILAERTSLGNPRPGSAIANTNRPSGEVNELPITMNLLGGYDSFKNFLRDLEQNLRIIDVENINFSATSNSSVFTFGIKVKTYYQ